MCYCVTKPVINQHTNANIECYMTQRPSSRDRFHYQNKSREKLFCCFRLKNCAIRRTAFFASDFGHFHIATFTVNIWIHIRRKTYSEYPTSHPPKMLPSPDPHSLKLIENMGPYKNQNTKHNLPEGTAL